MVTTDNIRHVAVTLRVVETLLLIHLIDQASPKAVITVTESPCKLGEKFLSWSH